MKIDEIKGKDVINAEGNKIGEVDDLELDLMNRRIEGIILREGNISAKVGLGEEKTIPCSMVDKIGDKVLLRRGSGRSLNDLDVITGGE